MLRRRYSGGASTMFVATARTAVPGRQVNQALRHQLLRRTTRFAAKNPDSRERAASGDTPAIQ